MTEDLEELRQKILQDVERYSKLAHTQYYPIDHPSHTDWKKGDNGI